MKCSQVSGPYLFVKISYSKLTFSYSKLTFLTRNSLFLLETHFSYSKLTFLTRNSLFLLETHFSYSKLTFPGNALQVIKFDRFYIKEGIQNMAQRRKYALLVPSVEIDGQFLLKEISTSVCWFGTAVSMRFFLFFTCLLSIICGCT